MFFKPILGLLFTVGSLKMKKKKEKRTFVMLIM